MSTTLTVTWHPDAVRRAVELAAAITRGAGVDDVFEFPSGRITFMDFACLVDVARAALTFAEAEGHDVVQLRDPDAITTWGAPVWSGYGVEVSGGQVWDGTRHLRPRGARAYAAELLSAANHADRQHTESGEDGEPRV